MSVFESFYLLFKADTTDLKKGEKDVKNIGNAFNDVAKRVTEAALAFASFGAIVAGTKSAADYAENLALVSHELNLSTESLDAWGNAVKQNGGTVQGFQQSIRMLNDNMLQLAATGNAPLLKLFMQLGVSVRDTHGQVKSVIDILPQLANTFQRIGRTRGRAYGKELGLDIGLIQLLEKGPKAVAEFIKQQKELGLVTKEDANIAHEYNLQWNNTAHALRSVFTVVNSALLPVMTKALEVFQKIAQYFLNHSNAIKGAFIAIAAVITGYMIPAIAEMVIAAGPMVLIIGAIIGAFALFYDDLKAFQSGNNSLIGKVIKKWEEFKSKIESIGSAFKAVSDSAKAEWDKIVHAINRVINALSHAREKFRSFIGLGHHKDNTQEDIAKGQAALFNATNTPLSLQTSNSLNNQMSHKSTSINTGPITIQTQATDSQGIASDMVNSLRDQMSHTMNTFSDGIVA